MSFYAYQRCTACSGKAQPGTVNLQGQLIQRFPGTRSMGIYNCRTIAGSSSLSIHSCGRAGDTGVLTNSDGSARTELGGPIVRFLIENWEVLGIITIIYNRVIYDDASPSGRYYGGVHPHKDHVHWEQTLSKSQSLTQAQIIQLFGAGGEEEMLPITPQSSRENIRLLQLDMNQGIGTGLVADGKYGPATAGEVKRWLLPATQADEDDGQANSLLDQGYEVNAAMWRALRTEIITKVAKGLVSSGGLTQATADQRYASKPAFDSHRHDEGTTGGPQF